MGFMFNNSGFSTENYDAFLIHLADNTSSEGVGIGNTPYSSDEAKTARDTLQNRGIGDRLVLEHKKSL